MEGRNEEASHEDLYTRQSQQQDREMEAQFDEIDLTEEDLKERATWRAIQNAAAKQRFGLVPGSGNSKG